GSIYSDDGSQIGGDEDLYHGTHVAITAGGSGNNGVGTSGVAPKCLIMPIQVGDKYGNFLTDIISGIGYAVENGAKVINISLGPAYNSYTIEQYADPARRRNVQMEILRTDAEDIAFVHQILAAVEAEGVVVVTSAGNDSLPADLGFIAQTPYSLTVGAAGYTEDGDIGPATFSNFGYMVQVCAPGTDIYSGTAHPEGNSYELLAGTSMASPIVAGLAGLIISANPDIKPSEVRKAIVGSSYSQTQPGAPRNWYLEDREVDREINAWHRAFLLLMGKDDSKLLDSHAQFFLMSLIRPEHNKVWDGPHVSASGQQTEYGDRAIGGFIDAHAALINAKNKTYQKQFAVFDNADNQKALGINSQHLFEVHDMAKFYGSYEGSKEIGGPFELLLKEPFKRLEVARDTDPGGDYSEWLEYIEPGTYQHVCMFNGEDYRQGPVKLSRKDNMLVIENLKIKKQVSYRVASAGTSQALTTPERFTTLAGGSNPNVLGKLRIAYTSPKEEIEEKEFLVYPAGAIPSPDVVVLHGKTDSIVELITGSYDIKILARPWIWIRGVEIRRNEIAELETGGYGKINITALDSMGNSRNVNFFMYPMHDKEDLISVEKTDRIVDALTGNYYIYLDLNPDLEYENVEISRGKTTEIVIPDWGGIRVEGTNSMGEPLDKNFFVFSPEDHDKIVVSGYTNKHVNVPPGVYDVYASLNSKVWFKGIEVKPREQTVLAVPLWGRLMLKDKKDFSDSFYVYKPDNKDDIFVVGYTNKPIELPPGIYDIKAYKVETWMNGVKIRAGQVTEVKVPR
ncbi:MAG: S8 family serine peptidase, partial [Candidatus Omnitrophota bacterium]|nr:S8 family serine peptidase [Candidatus Omnitrophota bacterium]